MPLISSKRCPLTACHVGLNSSSFGERRSSKRREGARHVEICARGTTKNYPIGEIRYPIGSASEKSKRWQDPTFRSLQRGCEPRLHPTSALKVADIGSNSVQTQTS